MRGDRLRWGLAAVVLAGVWAGRSSAQELREVRGRVVDEQGRPVAGATVADYWRANGPLKKPDGGAYDMDADADVHAFWGRLGRMEPSSFRASTTDADGRFVCKIGPRFFTVMAMDADRGRGGLIVLPKGREGEPVEIRIGPMVKLRGSFHGPGPGERPAWTHVYLLMPDEPSRPLDSTRLVGCGSFEARFEMSVPPGRYRIHGYDDRPDVYNFWERDVDLSAARGEVDLGAMASTGSDVPMPARITRAKSEGRWVDLADRYGKPAPAWSLAETRGIPAGARVEDFRGKWLLIYLWDFSCAPCLATGLPAITKLYEEHAADRDRFVAVAVYAGELPTLSDVDGKLESVVRHVWGGKPLPCPVARDPSYRTMENFGAATLGPILIDPQGNLVKGDEETLAEKLKARE